MKQSKKKRNIRSNGPGCNKVRSVLVFMRDRENTKYRMVRATLRSRSRSPRRTPSGPSTRRSILLALESYISGLPPPRLQALLEKLSSGILLWTDYSGTGQPEFALQRLCELAEEHGAHPRMRCARASDISPCCRKVLLAFDDADMCVLGDLVARQGKAFCKKVISLTAVARSRADTKAARIRWLKNIASLIASSPPKSEATAYCYRHDRRCPTVPPVPDGAASAAGDAGAASDVRAVIAGISCIDWSSRGAKGKTTGKGAGPWASFLRELYHSEPDVIILECTRNYRDDDLLYVLGSKYSLHVIVFSPTEVGIPSQRFRKYMVLLLHVGRLQWVEGWELSKHAFMQVFGRQLACTGHVYLQDTPPAMVARELRRWARRRHLPSRDAFGRDFSFESLMTRRTRVRLNAWRDVAAEQGIDASQESVFFDCSQNPQFGSLTQAMPAITCRNQPWSDLFARPVLAHELLEAQGFPAILAGATVGVELPWASVLHELTPSATAKLAGNSMHLAAVGLANLEI